MEVTSGTSSGECISMTIIKQMDMDRMGHTNAWIDVSQQAELTERLTSTQHKSSKLE